MNRKTLDITFSVDNVKCGFVSREQSLQAGEAHGMPHTSGLHAHSSWTSFK